MPFQCSQGTGLRVMESQAELALAFSLQHRTRVVPSSLRDSIAFGGFALHPHQRESSLFSSKDLSPFPSLQELGSGRCKILLF